MEYLPSQKNTFLPFFATRHSFNMFLTPRGNSCLSVGTDRHEVLKFKIEMEKLEIGWSDVKNWKGKL
jgi:hypothetical protein